MSSLTGTGQLVRLIVRRDRRLFVWVAYIAVIPVALEWSFARLYPSAAQRDHLVGLLGHNGTFVAMYGPLDGSSLGQLVTWRSAFIPVVIGVISCLSVIRHTRAEEESGRRELVGSTAVGRNAGLAAAVLSTCAADVITGGLVALGMVARHLPTAGSLALGLQLAAVGCAFAAVGAVAAQITARAATARGIACGVVGGAYLLRAVGDLAAESHGSLSPLSWLSPIGLGEKVAPYGANRFWCLAVVGVWSVTGMAVAAALAVRRDLGSGAFGSAARTVRPDSGPRSAIGLAWRLHRGLLLAWTAGLALFGIVLGGVAKGVGDLIGGNRAVEDVIARTGGSSTLVDAYLASVVGLLGLIAGAYAVQAALKLRSEEVGGGGELLLSTAVSRLRWAAGHMVFATLGPAVAVLAAGLAAGVTYGANTGQVATGIGRLLTAVAVQLPAIWVMAAVTMLLIGLVPRQATPAAWGCLAGCLLLGWLGAALQLGHWALDLSPFTHVPRLPGGQVKGAPLAALLASAAVLTGVGLAGLRRRSLA